MKDGRTAAPFHSNRAVKAEVFLRMLMKKTTYSLLTLMYLLFLFLYCSPAITPAIADAVIINHMMTRNPQWDTGCSTPIPTDTFSYTDEEAACWFSWESATGGSKIVCQWYKPDGELYAEQETLTPHTAGCWYSRILISGYAPANISGEWQVEVYVDGDMKFTEHFTIEGDPSIIPCPAELLYGEHGEETELLRNIRDDVLRQTPEGRKIITLYYQYSPAMAKALRKDEGLRKEAKKILDGILSLMIFLE